jgi:hypothetical protein
MTRKIDGTSNETVEIRLHRCESWWRKSRKAAASDPPDLDAQFVFLWVAFNALYGRSSPPPRWLSHPCGPLRAVKSFALESGQIMCSRQPVLVLLTALVCAASIPFTAGRAGRRASTLLMCAVASGSWGSPGLNGRLCPARAPRTGDRVPRALMLPSVQQRAVHALGAR